MKALAATAALILAALAGCAPSEDDAPPPAPAASFPRMLIDPETGPVLRALQQDFPADYQAAQSRLTAEAARGVSPSALEDSLHALVVEVWHRDGAAAADAGERRIQLYLNAWWGVLTVLHAAGDEVCARYVVTDDWGGWAATDAARKARAEADLTLLQAIGEGRQGPADHGAWNRVDDDFYRWAVLQGRWRVNPDPFIALRFGADRDIAHTPDRRCAAAMESSRALGRYQGGGYGGRLGARYLRALAAGNAAQAQKPEPQQSQPHTP